MSNTSQHIGFKILTILLVVTLLFPSAVKFNHVFENHKHEVCIDNSIDHFHELEIDCEFYKFNTTNQFFVEINSDIAVLDFQYLQKNNTYYNFLNSHRQLSFSLRGPPYTFV